MRGLADVCKRYEVVITGGETAICDTMRGYEMGITATGIFQGEPRAPQVCEGDVLIGLRSSGIHSNGLTFARDVYGLPVRLNEVLLRARAQPSEIDPIIAAAETLGFSFENSDEELDKALNVKLPWGRTVGEELTVPTTIYLDTLVGVREACGYCVHGMVHITGGGWTKLRELDQKHKFDFDLDSRAQPPHEIFYHIKKRSHEIGKPLDDAAMYTKFNCGTGFVIAVDPRYVADVLDISHSHKPAIIGEVRKGTGRVRIKSAFSDTEVVF